MPGVIQRGEYLPLAVRIEYIQNARRELLAAGAPLEPGEDRAAAASFWMAHSMFRRRSIRDRRVSAGADWQARCRRKRYIPPRIRRVVIDREGGQCHYCRMPVPAAYFVVDHVIPIARGGKSRLDNMVGACWGCNSDKADLLLSEWLPECWRDYLPRDYRKPA